MKFITTLTAVLALAVAAPAVACQHTGFGAIACQNCGGSGVQSFGATAAYADPGFAAPPVVQSRTRTTTTYSTQFAAPAPPPPMPMQAFGSAYQSFGAGSCATGACGVGGGSFGSAFGNSYGYGNQFGNGFGNGFGDTAPAAGHRRGFSLQFGFGRRR